MGPVRSTDRTVPPLLLRAMYGLHPPGAGLQWLTGHLSLTWNAIDPCRPVGWTGFDLEWRPDALPELQTIRRCCIVADRVVPPVRAAAG